MSQKAYQGVISTVNSKPWTDRATGREIFLNSFQIEGSNQWFRTGTTPIPFGRGQNVKFVADGQNADVSTMQSVAATVQTAPSVPQGSGYAQRLNKRGEGSTSGQASSKDEYWASKEARDLAKEARFQAVNEPRMAMSVAVTAASNIVIAAIQTDALSYGNVAKGKKVGMLADYVEELATRLAKFIENAPETLKSYDGEPEQASSEEQDSE